MTLSPPSTSPSSRQLAARLVDTVVCQIDEFADRYAPGFRLPPVLGGHLVGTDAVADVAFTLGLLAECGINQVGGMAIEEAIAVVLPQLNGAETHSFFSYRVAETLLRAGSFDGNPLLADLSASQVDNIAAACDSTELVPLLDGLLPRNYLAVLARCELARSRLSLIDDASLLDDLVAKTGALLSSGSRGLLDESHSGSGRFDMYAIDVVLFCEPLELALGDTWRSSLEEAFALADAVATDSGASISWGRSTGVLSEALTVELAGLAVSRERRDAPSWVNHAAAATDRLTGMWFENGLITAHQHRRPEDYRGPHRRMQMTFDVLGKMAYAAAHLNRAEVLGTPSLDTVDELRRFDEQASVWVHRSPQLRFVLPFVDGPSADYRAAPHWPGVFETPVDSPIPCFLPTAHMAGGPLEPQRRYAPAGRPHSIDHTPGEVVVTQDAFTATHGVDARRPDPISIKATRSARYRADGATLRVDETLTFADPPTALTVAIPSTAARPLRVDASGAANLRTVDVSGMEEWQSAWGPIASVTEIELSPASTTTLSWSVTPKSRVALTSLDATYVRTVFDPISDSLRGRVVTTEWTTPENATDVAHIHWPEWCFGYGTSLEEHRRIADTLRNNGTKIVWTQHNLTPHLDEPEIYDPIYEVWAGACDLAIHHSRWGQDLVTKRYRFRPDCHHEVIAHPHFGRAATPALGLSRDEAADRLGLRSGTDAPAIRIGVIGAPRRQKDLNVVIDAVRNCGRTDIELVLWSLSFTDQVPSDPNIVAAVYDHVERETYDLRLVACDAIALPFTEHSMLGTGTTSDLVAAGVPGLISEWPYLREHLGELGIAMGDTCSSWSERLAALTLSDLAAARASANELRARYDPEAIALRTASAIESLGVRVD